METRFGAGGGG
ncbi:hypothetical protein VCEC0012_001264A, partial [Vibrio cholerae O1 str. EC-0012]